MADIFISHASVDTPIAEALVQLLEGGVGLRTSQVFCSSLEGQKVMPGKDFKAYIKSELRGAQIVIGLISKHFYNSAFCMCELGAAWAYANEFVPLLVPPI